jgi:hypothetical protein
MIVLRDKLGATYHPAARIFRDSVQRNFAFVALINTFEPAHAQHLTPLSLADGANPTKKGSVERGNQPLARAPPHPTFAGHT